MWLFSSLQARAIKRLKLKGQAGAYAGEILGVPVSIQAETISTWDWHPDRREITYPHISHGFYRRGFPPDIAYWHISFERYVRRMDLQFGPQATLGSDVRLGRPLFDDRYSVQTERPSLALAFLDSWVRNELIELADNGVSVSFDGETWRCSMPVTRRTPELVERMATLVKKAALDVDRVPERLKENIAQTSHHRIRARTLLALLTEYPLDPNARSASMACLGKAPGFRFLAAVFLGPDLRGEWEAAAVADDAENTLPMVLSEIADKKYRDPQGRMDDALRWALEKGRPSVARAAWRACRALSVSLTAEQHIRFAGTEVNEEMAREVAGVLGPLSYPGVEPLLISWLGREAGLAQAAALVLGDIGTRTAVEPLMEVIRKAGLMGVDLKRAAREAIAKIQSRLGNAERGTISLAETAGPEGALSLAPQGGEVSEAAGEESDG